MTKQMAVAVALAISVAGNVYFFLGLTDAGLQIDDSRREEGFCLKDRDIALSLLQVGWQGKPLAAVEAVATAAAQNGVVVKRDHNAIELASFRIEATEGAVTKVTVIE